MDEKIKVTYIFMLSKADKMFGGDMLIMRAFTTPYRTKLWMNSGY